MRLDRMLLQVDQAHRLVNGKEEAVMPRRQWRTPGAEINKVRNWRIKALRAMTLGNSWIKDYPEKWKEYLTKAQIDWDNQPSLEEAKEWLRALLARERIT
jgi:hypothetical protein